jgi:CubicO group peptidase (beta-lactamase class C family)
MTNTLQLPRSSPEEQGIGSEAILAFVDAVEAKQLELHSLMLVRHGQVVAEGWWHPYNAELPHVLFSLSKSFCSTAAGLAIAEARFSLDDKIIDLFPDDLPDKVDINLAQMRVRDLLTMSTGHAEDTTGKLRQREGGNWVKAFLALPVEHKPGTHFLYNSGATYMVSAIVQKVTGIRVVDYLRARLFEPLGIAQPTWETCPRGIDSGGWGLNVRTEDIAKFGELYLRKGLWNGKRLLAESWIDQATALQVNNGSNPKSDWNQGYGFQFWRCRHNGYRGDGAFGQFCFVMPKQDAVLAITAATGDMQAVMDLVWQHLLLKMKPKSIEANSAEHDRLTRRLASLQISPPSGALSSPVAAEVSGRQYRFAKNDLEIDSIALGFHAADCTMTVCNVAGNHDIRIGSDRWELGETRMLSFVGLLPDVRSFRVAAHGAWSSADTLVINLCMYDTPFNFTLTLRFGAGKLTLDVGQNVSFGNTTWPTLESLPDVG